MFHTTRIKLTAWYLLIIMFVSITFSVVLFIDLNRELVRFSNYEHLKREKIHTEFGIVIPKQEVIKMDNQLVVEARNRLILNLAILNMCILAGSTLAGYFLAGKTLDPIKKMIEAQNRFIGDASHELKTPLTSLRSEIEVFLRGKKTLTDAIGVLESNLEETVKLQKLSESLINLSQYEQNQVKLLKFESLKIAELIDTAKSKVIPIANKKQISIKSNIKNTEILGDKQRLVELFTILFDNAVKYSNSKSAVRIRSVKKDNVVQIQIKDEGIGISSEDLPHIFERFYRADLSREKIEVGGYGLGLAIAQQIAQIHKGKILVNSVVGKGTTFIVELPA